MKKYLVGWVFASALVGTANSSLADTFTLHSPELAKGKFAEANLLSEPYGFGCKGGNLSPSFTWSGVPAGTKSFVLSIHDRDAPTGIGWMHWVVVNIPATAKSLPAAVDAKGAQLPAGALQTRTDFGVPGYGGPCPPQGSTHTYDITLTAIKEATLPMVDANSTPAMVGFFAKANALGEAKLTITQGR